MKIYLSYGLEDAPEGFEKREFYDLCPAEEISGHQFLDKVQSLITLFEHVNNALEVGGKAIFVQNYFRSPMAYMSPLTVRGISEFTLSWLSKEWRKANPSLSPDVDYDFEVQYSMSTDPELENRSADAKAFAITHYSGSIAAIQFIVIKK